MKAVDLHVHSNKSDGSKTPSELVDYAIEKGLAAFALTDHDTTDGLDEAIEYAKGKDIEVIPGIELSSEYMGRDIHIVGLFIDHKSPAFLEHLTKFRDSRVNRNITMCNKLRDEAGIDISYEALQAIDPGAVITRAHYARYLFDKGYTKSLPEAFERYIGDHCKYFVPREKITPEDAVKLILASGGIPVLAHPILYHMTKGQLDTLVVRLKEAGLMAIEAIYSTYSSSEERQIKELAKKYDLAISGGSDYHGAAKPGLELGTGYGKLYVCEEYLDKLRPLIPDGSDKNPNKKSIKKIFFTDLDETLLTTDKQISPTLLSAINAWMNNGNIFVLCSGRPTESIKQVAKQFNLKHENLYFVGFNGAEIYHPANDKITIKKTLIPSDMKKVWDIANAEGIHCHCYEGDHILAKQANEEIAFYQKTIKLPVHYHEDFPECITNESYKMLCISLKGEEILENLAVKIRNAMGEGITCIMSNPRLLEVFNSTAGKGSAVIELCNYLNIPIANSYAAGDQQNDISMIKAAGTGIAMLNAKPEVREIADKITLSDNNHDGLLPYLLN